MKNNIYKTILGSSVAFAACTIASAPTFAQSPLSKKEAAVRINAANGLLRDGKVDDAIAAYREVVSDDQQKNELNYNLAVAEYRKGNIDSAEQLFRDVAGSGDARISADSRYNLGNCQYANAVELAGKNKPAAIERLRQAIADYRGSLRGNPNNPDARANIELAGELIRKLEEEQKQEEEQKKQDQQQKEDQKQDDEQNQDQQQQDKQQDKNKEDQQQDQQTQQDQSDAKEQSDMPDQDQQKQDQQKQDQQENDKPENQEPQQQPEPEDQGKPEEQAGKNEQIPDGELKTAGEQTENKKADGSVAMADPNAKDGLMTREEALKMLQAVRDRDMLRRMQQQRRERSRHVTVERDW